MKITADTIQVIGLAVIFLWKKEPVLPLHS